MAEFKDYFSTGSGLYAAYRPIYPSALVDFLADLTPAPTLAWDCGCGSGQLSTLLADRFDRVFATDASAEQLANTVPHKSVEYRAAFAERSGLPDASADLITVAQAAHWFDLDSFYAEARRVARPQAIVALISYGVLQMDDEACGRVVRRIYEEDLDPYWPPGARLVDDGYRSLPFPFAEIAAPPLAMEVEWDLDALIGYARTWSAVRPAAEALGRDPIEVFRAELAQLWGQSGAKKKLRWPLSLRVGRV
jgi:SAM-dependent methyltransferase